MIPVKVNAKDLVYMAALAAAYFASAKLGLSLAFAHSNISAVWPPTGIALAAMLILGLRYFPAIFVGAFLANLTTAGTVTTSVFIAMGNTLEAVAGCYLINESANGRQAFSRLIDTVKFIFFGAILTPFISATVGVTVLFLAGFSDSVTYSGAWFTWWLGDASSATVIAPLIILWANDFGFRYSKRQVAEIALILITTTVVARAIFSSSFFPLTNYPLEFLIVPMLAWVSIRFTARGTMTTVLIVAALSIWGTLNGFGPFVGDWLPNTSLIFMQAFLMTIAATSLALAVTVWERKDTERALQEADHAKDEFLITLAHEVRNPLASVFSDLQLIQLGQAKYSKKKKAIKSIESDLRYITSLLDDLLDLSKVRQGKITLEREPVEVNAIAAEVAGNFKSIIESQKLNLVVKRSEKPLWIEADKKRIKQIVINLLSNSVKYSEPDGEIHLSAYALRGTAVIEVRDSGSGIDPASINKIFDMFNQPAGSDKREFGGFGGLGIGLTIVKKFVELHGGSVKAESGGVGLGSKFTVCFPLSRLPRRAIRARLREKVKGFKAARILKSKKHESKILVVDDNERAANTLAELLRHLGYGVQVAYSGAEAVKLTDAEYYRIIILDIGLPDVSGHDLGREIRRIYKKLRRELLLIALSGYGQQEDIKKSAEAGFDHHLVKPVDIAVIQNILTSAKL